MKVPALNATGWRSQWALRSPRERLAVRLALGVVLLALLWWELLGPAISTLRRAPAQHDRLDTQLQQVQQLVATAQALQAASNATPPAREVAIKAMEQATSELGEGARLSVQGTQASVTLQSVPPAALARWLAQLRVNARVTPAQAQLRMAGAGWSGTLQLTGPGLERNP